MSETQKVLEGQSEGEGDRMVGVLSIRVDGSHGNGHLWTRNGSWWCHDTVHLPPWQKERIRVSLGTRWRHEARIRREQRLRELAGAAR